MAIRGNMPPTTPAPVVPLVSQPAPEPRAPRPVAPEVDGSSALNLEPLPLEGTVELMELVKLDPQNIQELFTKDGALKPILNEVASRARSVIQDPTTAKGREAIKSMAYKVAQTKTALEAKGVELNRKLKALPAIVDNNKREAKEFLEALQAEIRRPVTEWEAEQARIEAELKAAEEAAALARQVEADHEIALTLNWAYDQKKAKEQEDLERAVQEREEEIAREAAEAERQASLQREADLKAAAEQAEREKAEAKQRQRDAEAREAQAKIDAEAARVKAQKEADERAEQAAAKAREEEQQRQAAAAKKDADEKAAREHDVAHKKAFNQEALTDLIKATGLDEQAAKNVVNAIYLKKVRHIVLVY